MNEIITKEAFSRREHILKLKKAGAAVYFEIGKELYFAEKNEDWLALGYFSMSSYMASPEVAGGLDLTRSWVERFKLNYGKFVEECCSPANRIALIEPSKLDEIRPIVTKENAEEWLNKAETLSRSDLRIEVRGEHEVTKKPIICPKCGHEF